ncbi:hypothetical protein GVAV_002857 [Gurleya vavrai]
MQFFYHLFVRLSVVYYVLRNVVASESKKTLGNLCDIEETAQNFEKHFSIFTEEPTKVIPIEKQAEVVLDHNIQIINNANQDQDKTTDLEKNLIVEKVPDQKNLEFEFLFKKISKDQDFYSLLSLLQPEQGEFYEELAKKKELKENEILLKEIEEDSIKFMEKNSENLKVIRIKNENTEIRKKKLLNDIETHKLVLNVYVNRIVQDLIRISTFESRANKKSELFENLIYDFFDQQEEKHLKLQKNLNEEITQINQSIDDIIYNIDGKIEVIKEIERKDDYVREDLENRKLGIYYMSLKIHLFEDEINELEEFTIEKPDLNLYKKLNFNDFNGLSFKLKLELYRIIVLKLFRKNEYIKIELKKLKMKLKNRNLMLKRIICFRGLVDKYYERIENYDPINKHTSELFDGYRGCKSFGLETYKETNTDRIHLELMITELQNEKKSNNEFILKMLFEFNKNKINIDIKDQKSINYENSPKKNSKYENYLSSKHLKNHEKEVSIIETKINENKVSVTRSDINLPDMAVCPEKINKLNDEWKKLENFEDLQLIQICRSDVDLINKKIKEIFKNLKSSNFKATMKDDQNQKDKNNQELTDNTTENQKETSLNNQISSDQPIEMNLLSEEYIKSDDQNNSNEITENNKNSSECNSEQELIRCNEEPSVRNLHEDNFEKNSVENESIDFNNPLI